MQRWQRSARSGSFRRAAERFWSPLQGRQHQGRALPKSFADGINIDLFRVLFPRESSRRYPVRGDSNVLSVNTCSRPAIRKGGNYYYLPVCQDGWSFILEIVRIST